MRFELFKARKLKKKTHQDVANAVGIDRSTYSKIENGTTNPNIEVCAKIAGFLDCDLSVFLRENVNFIHVLKDDKNGTEC